MSDKDWNPLKNTAPRRGSKVEWIAPSGAHVKGTFVGGVVWIPDGSDMYVYYTPVYWRYIDG